jgi:hypothetical protein
VIVTTLAELQQRRAALVEAQQSGIHRISMATPAGRREMESRSVNEITAALAALDREIAAMQGRRVRTFLPTFSKGLD